MTSPLTQPSRQKPVSKILTITSISALALIGAYTLLSSKAPDVLQQKTFDLVIHLKEKNGDHQVSKTLTCQRYNFAKNMSRYTEAREACKTKIDFKVNGNINQEDVHVAILSPDFVQQHWKTREERLKITGVVDTVKWHTPQDEIMGDVTFNLKNQTVKGDVGTAVNAQGVQVPRYDITLEIKA